ncbi:hypothetical protein ANTPLA_LOCUS6844 [Anthophora plagiata]
MSKFKAATTNRGKWNAIQMKQAVMYVLDGKLTLKCATEKYNVPRSTLHDKIKLLKSGKEIIFKPKLGRYEDTFDEKFPHELYNHIKKMDDRLMPLTKMEFEIG